MIFKEVSCHNLYALVDNDPLGRMQFVIQRRSPLVYTAVLTTDDFGSILDAKEWCAKIVGLWEENKRLKEEIITIKKGEVK